MHQTLVFASFLAFTAPLLSSCATGSCRQVANAEANAQAHPSPPAAPAPSSVGPGPKASRAKKTAVPAPSSVPQGGGIQGETVTVYKYDGSLQCGQGKAVPVADMERELSGIPVQSREKKPDGLMHIQVCGQPTGMVNAYVIPFTKLIEAEKRGFRRWNFE